MEDSCNLGSDSPLFTSKLEYDPRVCRQTHQWLTCATIRALAPYIGRKDTEVPLEFRLDDVLSEGQMCWVNPTRGKFAPLRTLLPEEKGGRWIFLRKNGFFRGIRTWLPGIEISALGLPFRLSVRYCLAKDDKRYLGTILKLHPLDSTEGHLPGAIVQNQGSSVKQTKTRLAGQSLDKNRRSEISKLDEMYIFSLQPYPNDTICHNQGRQNIRRAGSDKKRDED